jgi:hypothetical protein
MRLICSPFPPAKFPLTSAFFPHPKKGKNLNFKVLLRIVWQVERVCGALKSLLPPSVSNEALQTGKFSVILEAALELFGGRANKAISKKTPTVSNFPRNAFG